MLWIPNTASGKEQAVIFKNVKKIFLFCSVAEPDPNPDPPDPHVLGLLYPDPDLLDRGMDPDPDPALDPDPDPSIIMQK
jgi:hypothetical protein